MGSQASMKSKCCRPLGIKEQCGGFKEHCIYLSHTRRIAGACRHTDAISRGFLFGASSTMGSQASMKSKCCRPLGIKEQCGGFKTHCIYFSYTRRIAGACRHTDAISRGFRFVASSTMGSQVSMKSKCCRPLGIKAQCGGFKAHCIYFSHTRRIAGACRHTDAISRGFLFKASSRMGSHASMKCKCCRPLGIK
jgi:hypothetical protein